MLTSYTAQSQPILVSIPDRWQALRFFNLYRLLLSCIFLALYSFNLYQNHAAVFGVHLYLMATVIYLGLTLLSILTAWFHVAHFKMHVATTIILDILALTMVMHASGGLTTGIGMLIIIAITVGSLLTRKHMNLVFAAAATLALLFHTLVVNMTHQMDVATYTQAGILGILFFTTAILTTLWSKKLHESETLAKLRRADIIALEHLNEHIVQHMTIGVIAIDKQYTIQVVNEAAIELLNVPFNCINQPLSVASSKLAQLYTTTRDQTEAYTCHFQSCPTGPILMAEMKKFGTQNMGTVIFIQDASAMQQKALQMKLASLGRLTASIAHEIRNPLSAIAHAAQLLDESNKISSGERRLIEIITTHSDRLNEVIDNILQLSKHQHTQPQALALDIWLDDFVSQFMMHDDSTFKIDIQVADKAIVHIDESQLRQILTNLCENGLHHGCEHNKSPQISIIGYYDTKQSHFNLDIIDKGPGVEKKYQHTIFNAFFTTHQNGTGLGLYVAKELCEANNAQLTYVPRSSGSCFRIIFKQCNYKKMGQCV